MRRSTTKSALLMSALSLFLCFAMLMGSTFAWFTDVAESAKNLITAGNLDIELYHSDKGTNGANEVVGDQTKLFDDVDSEKWEPGAMAYEEFTVANAGNLALKYAFTLNAIDATVIDGKSFASVLKVTVVDAGFEYTRENIAAIPAEKWSNLATFTLDGELTEGGSKDFGIVIWWQPSEFDNLFNMNNGQAKGSVKVSVGVVLNAIQLNSESDSIDENYDANLTPGYTNVSTAAELQSALAAGENVSLMSDIDMSGWTTLASYNGTLLGNGFKLYNLAGENGLFEELNGATVKDLTIEGTINGTSLWTGLLAGRTMKGTDNYISNVTVNGTVDSDNYYTGGLIGADSSASTVIENCVNNADVTSETLFVGGIVGYTKRTAVISNAINKGDITGTGFVGGIVGFAACNDAAEDAGENDPSLYLTVKDSTNYGTVEANGTTYPDSEGGIIGAVGREGGKTPTQLCKTYVNNCTVLSGQKVYGMTVNMNGADPTGNVEVVENGVSSVDAASNASSFKDAATNTNGSGEIVMTDNITVEDLTYVNFAQDTVVNGNGNSLVRDTASGNPLLVNTTNKVTFENIVFESTKGSAVLATRKEGANIEVNDCVFQNHGAPSTGNTGVQVYASNVTMTFNNCTFNNMPVVTNSSYPEGIKLVFNNCTFNWEGDNCPGFIQIANNLKITVDLNDCEMNYTTNSQYTTAKTMISYNWPDACTININGLKVTGTRNNDKIWKICSSNNNVTINTTGELIYIFNGEEIDFSTYLK